MRFLDLIEPLNGTYSWPGPEGESTMAAECRGIPWLDGKPITSLPNIHYWLERNGMQPEQVFRLDGDFLLAYQTPTGELCLFRPLTSAHTIFYRIHETTCIWSTDITMLMKPEWPPITIDTTLIAVFASTGEAHPESTPYHEIHCLQAGQWLRIDRSGKIQAQYDRFHLKEHYMQSWEDAAEHLRVLYHQAIQQAVYGYDAVGILMSGGVDSSILAYEAVQANRHVEGFHWTWSSISAFRPEQEAAQEAASMLNIPLHSIDGAKTLEPPGTYVSLQPATPLPYNHSFLSSFHLTAQQVQQRQISLLLSGHLGDTLFESTPVDGILAKFHREHLFSAIGDLIGYDNRHAIWKNLFSRKNQQQILAGSAERIADCPWLTGKALTMAQQAGQMIYQTPFARSTLSTQHIYQSLMSGINSETLRDASRCQTTLYPAGVALRHPMLNRALIEFSLALDDQYRALFAAGIPISKPLARYAYLGRLPANVIRRESRIPYATVNEYFVLRHREWLWDILGNDSCLEAYGMVDSDVLFAIMNDTTQLRKQTKRLLPAAGVELWLRTQQGRLWLPPPLPGSRTALWNIPHISEEEHQGCLALGPEIHAYVIDLELVLIHDGTGQVLKIDEQTHLLLRLCQQLPTREEAMTQFLTMVDASLSADVWDTTLNILIQQKWFIQNELFAPIAIT